MTDANNEPVFHSGRRLQKLRELQGLTILELARALKIDSTELRTWETQGIPGERIKDCYDYFEVSAILFSQPVDSQTAFNQLVASHLLAERDNNPLQTRLQASQNTQAPQLDLSGLELSEIPPQLFDFTWLRQLNLSNNKFKRLLPSQMMRLSQLEALDISHNQLQLLPGILNNLPLQQLNFSGNALTLQPALSHSTMNLEAYRDYLHNSDITIILTEPSAGIGHARLDALSDVIEKIHPLLLTTVTNAAELLKPHKQQLHSIIYLTPYHQPEQLTEQLKSLLQTLICPLIIYTGVPQRQIQYAPLKQQLMIALPTHAGLISQADDQTGFATLFADIQRRIAGKKPAPKVKFEQLILDNIGVYQHLEINLNPELTVLVGLNGAGKTTILKALALATTGPEHADSDATADLLRISGNQDKQIHRQPQGSIILRASIDGQAVENTINLSYNSSTEKVEIQGNRFEPLFDNRGHLINLMLGIGEQRNTSLKKARTIGQPETKAKVRDLLPIINGEEQTCIADVNSWLSKVAFAVSQGESDKQALIDISFAVFSTLMQESIQFVGLTDIEPTELLIEHQDPKQRVPLRLASQGYQAVMGWIGFILQRMFEACPDALQPLQQPAIILIDEIDQLLHIKWQQRILDVLAKQFFPNSQWIITTHSPMVVNGLDQAQVIQLHQHDGQLIAEPNNVDLWQWQYADIINYLFGISQDQPQFLEQPLRQQIAAIEAIAAAQLSPANQQELEKLQQRLAKVQKSRAYVDELYAEQQKLRTRELELAALIEQLSPQQPKV